MFNAAYDDDQRSAYAETILSCPCSRSITNELLRLRKGWRLEGMYMCYKVRRPGGYIWVTCMGNTLMGPIYD